MKNPIDEIAAFYDATANNWAESWYKNESLVPLLEAFLGQLPPHPRVLDAGCGAGYETMRLARLGADAVGVDISEKSLDIARRMNPGIPFYRMDMGNLDDSLGLFDGVIAIASLLHIAPDSLPDVLRQIKGRLLPGGLLWAVVHEGNGFNEQRSLKEIDGVHYNRHFYGILPEDMDRAATAAGLLPRGRVVLPDEEEGLGFYCMAYQADPAL